MRRADNIQARQVAEGIKTGFSTCGDQNAQPHVLVEDPDVLVPAKDFNKVPVKDTAGNDVWVVFETRGITPQATEGSATRVNGPGSMVSNARRSGDVQRCSFRDVQRCSESLEMLGHVQRASGIPRDVQDARRCSEIAKDPP